MSEKNGDRARFGKRRQGKLLRRKRLREQNKAMNLENLAKTSPTVSG